MTRETKAGLVVSCSFVCLVAVVLFAKLREKSAASASQDEAALTQAPADPTPLENEPAPTAGKGIKGAGEPPTAGLITSTGVTAKEGGNLSEATRVQNALTKPAEKLRVTPEKTAPPSEFPLQSVTTRETPRSGSDDSRVAAGPAPNTSSRPAPDMDSIKVKDKTSESPLSRGLDGAGATAVPEFPLPTKAVTDPTKPASDPAKTGGQKEFTLPDRRDIAAASKAGNTTPVADVTKSTGNPRSPWELPPPPAAVATPSNAKDPVASAGGKGSTPPSSKSQNPFDDIAKNTTQPNASTGIQSPAPLSGAATSPTFEMPLATPHSTQLANDKGGTTVLPPLGASTLSPNSADTGAKDVRLGSPSTTSPPPNQLVQGPASTEQPSANSDRSLNRVETPSNAPLRSAPTPVIIPAVSPASNQLGAVAQVESYDEETYVCRPSDTFRSISQAYFKTDKYERALLLFNRNHPLATEAVRQNPPALREGQSVYIPPQRILDKYYGSVIGDGSSQAPAAIPTSQSGQQNSPATEKAYRVRANGEMFYDIARRTLGSGERWQEIYRLNPRFDPKDPVPAGSELRVPSDARIDPADAP